MEIDPVCGMEVDPKTAAGTFEYEGETYYFCSQGCLEDLKEDPESYLVTPGSIAEHLVARAASGGS